MDTSIVGAQADVVRVLTVAPLEIFMGQIMFVPAHVFDRFM
jgi:hypothetical protein